MHSRPVDGDLVGGFAVIVLITLAVIGLHWLGIDTGIPRWLACSFGQSVFTRLAPGLIQLLLVVGVLLALIPWWRRAGVSLIILGIGGMVTLQLWGDFAAGYCSFTAGFGSTP